MCSSQINICSVQSSVGWVYSPSPRGLVVDFNHNAVPTVFPLKIDYSTAYHKFHGGESSSQNRNSLPSRSLQAHFSGSSQFSYMILTG